MQNGPKMILFFLLVPMGCLLFGGDYPIQTLSTNPRIYLIDNFLTGEECDHIIEKARDQLVRSTVVDLGSTSGEGKVHTARTSSGMFFPKYHFNPVLKNIEKRIEDMTQIPLDNGEGLQVLHYTEGGEYKPHYDYFDPNTTGGAVHLNRGGQRVATLIMYLHTVEAGGETIFPLANVSVKPIKGRALLFYNCHPNGQVDSLTLHGGAPVIQGEKWIATKWLRMGVFY